MCRKTSSFCNLKLLRSMTGFGYRLKSPGWCPLIFLKWTVWKMPLRQEGWTTCQNYMTSTISPDVSSWVRGTDRYENEYSVRIVSTEVGSVGSQEGVSPGISTKEVRLSHEKVKIGKRVGDLGVLKSSENKSRGWRHSVRGTDTTG